MPRTLRPSDRPLAVVPTRFRLWSRPLEAECQGTVRAGGGGGHRLDRDARLDVQLQRLAAGEDGVEAPQRAGRRRSRRRPRATSSSKSGCAGAIGEPGVHEQHVAVERGEVDQRPVERVALRRGWPATSAASPAPCIAPAVPRVVAAVPLPVPPAPSAICSASVSAASSVADSARGLGLGRADQVVGGGQAGRAARSSDAGIASTVGAVLARRLVAGQPPRPADVALPTPRPPTRRVAGVDAVAPRSTAGDRRRPAACAARRAGTASGWSPTRRRGAATARRAGTRCARGGSSTALSSALDACSVSRSASSITTTCQRPSDGTAGRPRDHRRASRRPRSTAPRARPSGRRGGCAPATVWQAEHSPQPRGVALALQRGGERARGDRAAGAGRAGEQPGVGHRRRVGTRPPRRDRRGRRGRTPQPARRAADRSSRMPDSRSSRLARADGACAVVTAARRGRCARLPAAAARRAARVDRAPRICAAISSTGRVGVDAPGSGAARPRRGAGTPAAPARGSCSDSASSLSPAAARRGPGPAPTAGGMSSSTVRSGASPSVAQRESRRTSSIGSVRARALVGQRRVDVPVGEHDLAGVERGPDDGVDVVGAVGGEQQRLGARRQRLAVGAARSRGCRRPTRSRPVRG